MIRGGKSLVSAPPAFSNDAKKLLICTANSVSIFSISTALLITELEAHMAPVTSVIVVPASTPANKVLCYCWTSSLDGTIRYWDFSSPELMKTISIRFPIFSMVIPSILGQPAEGDERPADCFAYVSVIDAKEQVNQSKGGCGQIRKCNLTQSRLAGGVILAETPQPGRVILSPSGKFFGIWSGRKLYIWEVPAKDADRVVTRKIKLHHTKNMTALAFHPTESIVAAGDLTGRILIWRGVAYRTFATGGALENDRLMENEDPRPGVRGDDEADSCSTWHWHPSEVKILVFSSDGAHLYSGGKEGVFVVWQLETGKKKFLPRIGSPLRYFIDSPDPSLSSISCADNRVHLLKMPSMEILKTITGIKLPYLLSEVNDDLHDGVAFNQSAGLVALRTDNYCVQLFSLFDDREISEVQVCQRNHQPGDDVTVVLTLVALSLDGSMMSTVEVKFPEEDIGGFVSLKFWACFPTNKEFSLSTVIYEPHRDATVSAVVFHPTKHMAVSCSHGGDFKIWVSYGETQQKDQHLQNHSWICHAVGSYKNKHMMAAAFSADGSVLAVAAETVITLWDPEKNVLVAVIGKTLEPITKLSFVGQSEYLVSASRGSKPQLSVWSLSKLSVWWSYQLITEAVSCMVDASTFAVLALLPKLPKCKEPNETMLQGKDGMILLFNSGEPVPEASWFVRKAKGGGLAFVDASSLGEDTVDGRPSTLLAYINGDHEYVLFDPYGKQSFQPSAAHKKNLVGSEETENYGYASVYGELPEFDLKRSQTPLLSYAPSGRPWETIFNGPSHSLPPLTKLCSVFLESLLERRSATME